MATRNLSSTGTIPDNTALAGTVTSNTDTTVLTYVGSNDIADIMTEGKLGENSTVYIYVSAATPKVSKVIGLYKNSNNNYSIFLETGMAGASASACAYVPAAISYSYTNTGSTTVTVDGVSIIGGVGDAKQPYQKYSNRPKFHPAVYVNATGGTLFISEET